MVIFLASEVVYKVRYCRFLGSFEPLFDSNCGGHIDKSIWPPQFESKSGEPLLCRRPVRLIPIRLILKADQNQSPFSFTTNEFGKTHFYCSPLNLILSFCLHNSPYARRPKRLKLRNSCKTLPCVYIERA